jgi:diguanylate cyclase (GGDEF)-like protein
MREGRFAGLRDPGPEAVVPLRLSELLLFDFRPAASEDHARVAAERARTLAVSVPFLTASHILWGLTLLAVIIIRGEGLSWVSLPLAAIVALDAGLWAMLRPPSRPPHAKAVIAALYIAVSAGLWAVAVLVVNASGESGTLIVRAALVAGVAAAMAAFFAVPLLLILSAAVTVGCIALFSTDTPLLPIAGVALLPFGFLSVWRTREIVFSAQQRLAAEWEAKKARRFIAEFEGSGRGWFWETNADGAVTYLSEQLTSNLDLPPGGAVGSHFEDLLLVKHAEGSEDARRALSFHLAARFPFADVIVRAPGHEDTWWSLSGSPNFDQYGRFKGFRGIGTNLSEQRRTEAEQTKLARYDSLTGLANRAMMRSTLDEALANAAERRKGCALMMIDLDRFKQVNDTLGHPIGDKLLKQVAQRLEEVLGQDGQVGRLGGDEFEAILPGIAEETRLSDIAQRLIDEVSRAYTIEGYKVEIGASIGIAIAWPGKSYASALIKDADLALYAAKAAGRGTFRFFAQEMHSQAAERQTVENDLRDALGKDQLRLLFQPIVESVSEEIVAFEALLRWQHPTRGELMPLAFLAVAEDCGLMPRIGAWVLRSACAEAAKWPEHVRIAVNLSPAQFADRGLPSVVTSALASSGIAPDRLELEIGEGGFPADGAARARMLARLKGIGVRLALDNFGTGQSGLGHLRDAPLDKIKIDRSFIRGASDETSRNAAIVRAIVALAESLRMDTTAQGIETLEELALIRRLGCSQVQGFLFGKPVPAEDALAVAAASKPASEAVAFSRPPRHRLIRMGTLQHGGTDLPVRLRNISAGGAMIECERPIATGSTVTLDLEEAGRLDAEVRWSLRGQIGLKFAEPFELRRLARVRPGASGLKMMTPQYLDQSQPAVEGDERPRRGARSGGRARG